jgi:hypothetical protein
VLLRFCPIVLAGVATVALAGGAQADDRLGMLMNGRYDCELPRTAGEPPPQPDPAASFTVISSSRYIGGDGSLGTYLRIGKIVQMTSGALAGVRLVIVRSSFLRRIDESGQPGPMRCVLSRATDQS